MRRRGCLRFSGERGFDVGVLPSRLGRTAIVLKRPVTVRPAIDRRSLTRSVSSYPASILPSTGSAPRPRDARNQIHLQSYLPLHLPLLYKFLAPHPQAMPGKTADDSLASRADSPDQPSSDGEMPELKPRWLHTGAKYLQLLPTPITVAETGYKAFSDLENQRIEAAWEALPVSKREKIVSRWGREDGEGGEKVKSTAKSKGTKSPASAGNDDDKGDVPSDPELLESDTESEPKKDEQYRAIIERNYHDPDKLDVVEGVAVSQVRPERKGPS